MRRDIIDGAYWMRPPGPNCQLVVAYTGAVAPEAIEAVKDGRLLVTVRNSSVRIHWGAMVIGAMAATGAKDIPKYIQIDGPVVTKEIAAGMAFMEAHFLL